MLRNTNHGREPRVRIRRLPPTTHAAKVDHYLKQADSCSRAGSDIGEAIAVARANVHATLALLDEVRRPRTGAR